MHRLAAACLASALLTFTSTARADESCPDGKVCVDKADMPVFLGALREKKCLVETKPTVTADPITIVTDRQGRVYGSGSDPAPFTMRLQWCNYDVTAAGQTSIIAAQRVEPTWGFRFRPKATFGILGTELLVGESFVDTLDGGILLEPFYYRSLNFNGYVGVRSAGAGVGLDLTKNFGVNVGYSVTWGGWRSNPFVSLYFAFW